MIPTYTTSVSLPKICLAFDWPTHMKFLEPPLGHTHEMLFVKQHGRLWLQPKTLVWLLPVVCRVETWPCFIIILWML